MLITSSLEETIFGSPAKIRILKTLYSWQGGELTERQLASICRLSTFGLRHALADLERWNIVTKKVVGRSHVWTINRQTFIHASLMSILEKLTRFPSPLQIVTSLLKQISKQEIDRIFLFGSVMEKDFDKIGDVDVAIILKKSVKKSSKKEEVLEKLEAISGDFMMSLGKRLEIHIFTHQEWEDIKIKPLGQAISRGQEIHLHEAV